MNVSCNFRIKRVVCSINNHNNDDSIKNGVHNAVCDDKKYVMATIAVAAVVVMMIMMVKMTMIKMIIVIIKKNSK